ncbi:hypothetical protein BSM4216_1077 [Bacillus smithii]|jgi:hypothetical protein|nr:hypothetical protein BSM4216_1077 [Bacillus smithii]
MGFANKQKSVGAYRHFFIAKNICLQKMTLRNQTLIEAEFPVATIVKQ